MVDAAGDLASLPRQRARPAQRDGAARDGVTVEALSSAWLDRYADFASRHPHGPAQEPVWLRSWHAHASPDIVALTRNRDGEPVLMLALEVVRQGPFRLARFVGGSHANANLPAAASGWSRQATAADLKTLARRVRAARRDIDLLVLERMTAGDADAPNPLLAAGGAQSPNPALSLGLDATMAGTLTRIRDKRKAKKHRSKRRKFDEAGGFRRIEAGSPAEVEHLLSAFFRFKEVRFRQAGIPNVFAGAEVQSALRAVFTDALSEPSPAFVLHGLEVAGELRAVSGSSRTPERTTCDFVGISEDELSRQSPGEFLFYENIEAASLAGQRFYDFGIGDEPYKRHWCDIETGHFDVAIPLTAKGHALAAWLATLRRAKAAVKRNPALWQAFRKLRRGAAGRSADADGEE